MPELSLLWLDQEKHSVLSEDVIKNLDLEGICNHIGKSEQEKKDILSILVQLTNHMDTIQYRSDIFDELMNDPDLRKQLKDILHKLHVLGDFKGVRMNGNDTSSIWELINRLKELYSYIECIGLFYQCLGKKNIQSMGLRRLKDEVTGIYEQSGFKYLKQDIERLTEDISSIKSLTLGVNLDKDLNPCEVQLVSMNHEEFKGQENGVLKAFVTCFAGSMANSLLKSNNGIDPLMNGLTKRVEEYLSVIVKDMRSSLNKYVDVQGYGITKLIPELTFYLRFADLCSELEGKGLVMCKAECQNADHLDLKDFYNLRLALQENSSDKTIITNDFIFDRTHRQYILTGPNRGGKTIFTQAVGLIYVLAQAGVYVPAKSMSFTPIDQIWTHFPADENRTISLGRLGEEAKRLRTIIEHVTKDSLVLLNESLSSTNYSEGMYIAKDIMKTFNYIGSLIIYNTHMHELAQDTKAMEVSDKYGIISLVMGIEGDKRNYKAIIAPPTGNSYAKDIAYKYGILYEQMIDLVKQK